MAQLTKAAFLSKYLAIFADNATREITEQDLRDFREDLSDSSLFLDDNFIDEDSFASDSAVKAPSQQSVKAYVDGQVGSTLRINNRVVELSGTNTYTGGMTPAFDSDEAVDGLFILFSVVNANTSRTVTINLDSQGALPVVKLNAIGANAVSQLHVGDLHPSGSYLAVFSVVPAAWIVLGIPEHSFEFGITATSKTLDAVNRTYVFTGSSAANWDLPTPTGNGSTKITIKNRGSQDITLDSNSGSQIYGGAAQASLTIGPGEAYTLLCDGTFFNIL
jgi:hypothetical protein